MRARWNCERRARLAFAGIYGAGFIGDMFLVTDLGSQVVLTVNADEDAVLMRLMPPQIVADPAGGFRLDAGRRYVILSR